MTESCDERRLVRFQMQIGAYKLQIEAAGFDGTLLARRIHVRGLWFAAKRPIDVDSSQNFFCPEIPKTYSKIKRLTF